MPDFHTTNLFPLTLSRATVDLTCFEVQGPNDVALTPALLGELAFHLGRRLHTLAQVRGAGLVAAGRREDETTIELDIDEDRFTVTASPPQSVRVAAPAWAESIRRLLSEDLRRQLLDGTHALWYRAGSYYECRLETARGSEIAWCEGTTIEVVSLPGGGLALAVDRTLARLGRPLGAMKPGERATYIADDPYLRPQRARGDEDEPRASSKKQRNYVQLKDGVVLRRVYVDVERTLADQGATVHVRRGHTGPSEPIDPGDLRPVLAPGEIPDNLLPPGSRPQLSPGQRSDWARGFLQAHAGDLHLLGGPATVGPRPVEGKELGFRTLPWPSLALGSDGGAVAPPTTRFAEHRVEALKAKGFRHVPSDWGGVMIVPLEGQMDLARTLLREVRGWLMGWNFKGDPLVRMCDAPLPREGGASQRVQVVLRHLRELPLASRPSALIVFKEDGWRSGGPSQDIYQATHEQLGRQGGFPLKVIQARHYDDWEPVAQIDLLGVLARAGAVPWGLAPSGGRAGLHHDLVFAMDIGGRDRSSNAQNERVGFVAMAGASAPGFHHAHPDAVREAVPPELLKGLVLNAARALSERSHEGWLFLRDGRFSDLELEALRLASREAIAQRLLKPGHSFTAVEVHKAHALRIFGVQDNEVVQPEAGTVLWLSSVARQGGEDAPGDALLASTGQPWNLGGARGGSQATARPVRCIVRTISGPRAHDEALEDIWRMTHLPWQMPRAPLKLPFPLHCTTTLLEDLANGRLPYKVPC